MIRILKRWGVLLFCLLFCIGCANQIEKKEQIENNTRVERTFAITEETSIREDFE